MKKITIIIPCYNEQDTIPIFYKEVESVSRLLSKYSFELIFVDDGSTDKSLSEMKDLSAQDGKVKYISFSRNFGKEAALYAGLKYASGDYVVVMDVDLQDPPSLLPEMLRAVEEEGYDAAATRRVDRKGEPPIRSFFARIFYKLMHKIAKTEIVDGARDFRLMTRQFVDSLLELKEYNRFSKGLFGWCGYKTKWIEYENRERSAGETKWSFWKLLLYSIDGIVAFSTVPLALSAIMGLFFCALSFIFILIIVIKTIVLGDPVAGWPSLVCIMLFLGGIQLFSIGVLGEYQAKTYLEIKKRPIFVCKEMNIDKK